MQGSTEPQGGSACRKQWHQEQAAHQKAHDTGKMMVQGGRHAFTCEEAIKAPIGQWSWSREPATSSDDEEVHAALAAAGTMR
mmetsp:Transcript_13416/g.31531  ORF Transcript_13416/g.31531 Transcript_13416/m.31531 type:complete len:82 (-) Transcript_13416:140-385(-)